MDEDIEYIFDRKRLVLMKVVSNTGKLSSSLNNI